MVGQSVNDSMACNSVTMEINMLFPFVEVVFPSVIQYSWPYRLRFVSPLQNYPLCTILPTSYYIGSSTTFSFLINLEVYGEDSLWRVCVLENQL